MRAVSPDLARNALDAAPDPMVIIDGAGVVRFANRQVSSVFGYEHDEVVGQSIELLLPSGRRELDPAGSRPQTRQTGLEQLGRRSDGTELPVELSVSPIDSGQDPLVAISIRDVSRRKQTETELIEAREVANRAREIAIRAREVAVQAREAADRANQAKSRFLATASHDLRQPLQTLELLNGSLRRMATSAAVADAVVQQGTAIAAMSRLLNALLDISKLEAGAIRPEPADFEIAPMFEELRRAFTASATAKGLRLEVEAGDECARSDPSLIEQVLRNLVSNAIKYTQRGSVTLRCVTSADGTVGLEVIDTGIGIPPAQLQYIYDEFFQVGVPTSGSRDGYGLGLSIVQRIVRLLNLRLEVRSQPGKGSAFSLSVPTSRRHPAHLHSAPADSRMVERRSGAVRVLLVEDDRSVRDATRLLLSVEGYEVTAVGTAAEAQQHAAEHGVDLLVTDYHLANGETGTAVISALQETLGADMRTILITGDTSRAVKELPRNPRMRITSKPVNADELLMLMRGLLAA